LSRIELRQLLTWHFPTCNFHIRKSSEREVPVATHRQSALLAHMLVTGEPAFLTGFRGEAVEMGIDTRLQMIGVGRAD
jgi:hypothetical protein